MSTKKSHASRAEPAQAQAALPSTDWPRQQMALWAGGACAMFRGFEAMRRVQMKTAHEALAQHQAAAEKLREPCSLAELMAVQADLLRYDTQGAALYWQQLGATMLEMQRQLMGSVAHAAEADTEAAATSLAPNAWAMPGLTELLQAAGGNGAQRPAH